MELIVIRVGGFSQKKTTFSFPVEKTGNIPKKTGRNWNFRKNVTIVAMELIVIRVGGFSQKKTTFSFPVEKTGNIPKETEKKCYHSCNVG